jgi:guanylate kinase
MMASVNAERGVLVIVSSPSGAGKTTLTHTLLREFPRLEFSVSYTTRPIRNNEIDGRDYHFVTAEQFDAMAQRGEFAEHAFVHGNRYGTALAPIEAALARGGDVIFDVDWQGGAALSAQWPQDALKIFILPPDLETLAWRLKKRATDTPDVIDRRLQTAIGEIAHFTDYEHLIVNDELERAYELLRAIYLTRRHGTIDRADVPYPLTQYAAIVERNLSSGVREHARGLASGGRS